MNEIGMTDYQLRTILKMVKMILDGCSTIEEAREKIDILLNDDARVELKH